MYQNTLLVVDGESRKVIAQATQALSAAGLQVVRSFDLQVARSTAQTSVIARWLYC
jgi:hypothetical protein